MNDGRYKEGFYEIPETSVASSAPVYEIDLNAKTRLQARFVGRSQQAIAED